MKRAPLSVAQTFDRLKTCAAALEDARKAAALARDAGCAVAAKRLRAACKSLDGAVRHAARMYAAARRSEPDGVERRAEVRQ